MIIGESSPADPDHVQRRQRPSIRQNLLDTMRAHQGFWRVRPEEPPRRRRTSAGDHDLGRAVRGVGHLSEQPR